MSSRHGPVQRARERGAELRGAFGRDIRAARVQHGVRLEDVGRAVGLTGSVVGRIERGVIRSVEIETMAAIAAAVGLDLSLRCHPAGEPLRDAPQLALVGRLRSIVHPSARWRNEVPMPIAGDRRAWDAVVMVDGRAIAVEAETRPRDLQDLGRRIAAKQRDSGTACVILLLADTRHNRHLVKEHAVWLAATYPVPGRVALTLLAAGSHPGGSSIILL